MGAGSLFTDLGAKGRLEAGCLARGKGSVGHHLIGGREEGGVCYIAQRTHIGPSCV